MRNRLLLLGLAVLAFLTLKVIEYLLPWPAACVLLAMAVIIMMTHLLWLCLAQDRERRKVARGGQKVEAAPEWLPSVDILIPAKNEGRVIENTVRNFFKIDYPDYNICVIDDGSDDNTFEILDRLKKEFPRLTSLHRPPGSCPGKSAGLNDALPLCRSEVIAVFDADASVAPNFLREILPALRPEGVGAVQAQKKIYQHQKFFLASCQASEYALDTYFQVGRDLIGGAVELRGNGQLIKRSALIDVGGWNNKSITDDLDLTMRLLLAKLDVRFSPDTVVWEEAVPHLKGLLRQRRRWAEGSIRRYLDYIFPLNEPNRLSMVERLDILAFLTEFAVPGLMALELFSEACSFMTGGAIYPRFLLTAAMLVASVSAVNLFIAIRIYRSELSLVETFFNTLAVNVYLYAHWVPCVMFSFYNICFKQQASKWHRTEHLGGSV